MDQTKLIFNVGKFSDGIKREVKDQRNIRNRKSYDV